MMLGVRPDARSRRLLFYKIHLIERSNYLSINAKRKNKKNRNSLILTVLRSIYLREEIMSPCPMSLQIIHLQPSHQMYKYYSSNNNNPNQRRYQR